MGMKPVLFGLGLMMLFTASACAQGVEDPGAVDGPRDESVLSGEASSDSPLAALRSRVSEDFSMAPSMRGHEIVLAVTHIEHDADLAIIAAHVTKRAMDGAETELESADFIGLDDIAHRAMTPYRADVVAVAVMDPNGRWAIIKENDVTRHAVEGYAAGLSPIEQTAWAHSFVEMRARRHKLFRQ